MLYTD